MAARTLNIGIAGKRGLAFLPGFRSVPGAVVTAFCELDAILLKTAADREVIPLRFTEFSDMLEQVDAVVVATPMPLHAPQAIEALRAGKHVLSEVPAAVSLEECASLLTAAAEGPGIYMLAENYCYLREVVLVREMVRRGLFGEVYFGQGEYLHEIRNLHHAADGRPTWRAEWQVGLRGCTYPTHSLGPVMQWFREVDPRERIAAVSCFGTGVHTDPEHPHDDTSLMLCTLASGKLIQVRLDMLSNRPHQMAFYALQGTRGVYEASRRAGEAGRVWIGENRAGEERAWRPINDVDHHLPGWWTRLSQEASRAGHGGGDFFVARAFAEAALGQGPPPIDIHDALEWTAAGLCSQISITRGGLPVTMPISLSRLVPADGRKT
jgi:predicted dehydrogenase